MAHLYATSRLDIGTGDITGFFSGGATAMYWSYTTEFGGVFHRVFDGYEQNGFYGGINPFNESYWFAHACTIEDGSWDTPDNSAVLNTWQHTAWSWDSTDLLTPPVMYVNGVSVVVNEGATPLGTAGANTVPLHVGASSDNSSGYVGRLDDMRLYKRVLSPSEILDIFHSRGDDGNVVSMLRRISPDISPSGVAFITPGESLSATKDAIIVTETAPTNVAGITVGTY